MSNQINNSPEHDKVFALLPWYVNKSLAASERESVSQHLAQCDECQSEIQFLTSMNHAAQDDAASRYSVNTDVDNDLASVMNRIDTQTSQAKANSSLPSLLTQVWEKISSLWGTFPTAQRGATALASLLVVVLGFQIYSSQTDNDYTVLSSPDVEAATMRLSVAFAVTADQEQIKSVIEQEFEKLGQQVVIESEADGAYIVVIKDNVEVQKLNSIIIELERKNQINRVELMP